MLLMALSCSSHWESRVHRSFFSGSILSGLSSRNSTLLRLVNRKYPPEYLSARSANNRHGLDAQQARRAGPNGIDPVTGFRHVAEDTRAPGLVVLPLAIILLDDGMQKLLVFGGPMSVRSLEFEFPLFRLLESCFVLRFLARDRFRLLLCTSSLWKKMYGLSRGAEIISGTGSSPMASRKCAIPTRWISSPTRSRLLPYSPQKSQIRETSSLMVSSSSAAGTRNEKRRKAARPGGWVPWRQSGGSRLFLPGTQRLRHHIDAVHAPHALAVVDGELLAVPGHALGRTVLTNILLDVEPAPAYSAMAASSCWMSSFQVPMTERSARAIDATQSLGHPLHLILNLYGKPRTVQLILVGVRQIMHSAMVS